MSQFTLKEVIRQTIFSISDNDNNKLMTGELFEINENQLKVVSLDGHRVSIRNIQLNSSYELIKKSLYRERLYRRSARLSLEQPMKMWISS